MTWDPTCSIPEVNCLHNKFSLSLEWRTIVMHMIKNYRVHQQQGPGVLTAQSKVIDTPRGMVEYADRGEGSAVLISHGSFGGFDQGLASVYFLEEFKNRFIAPSRFGYLRSPMPLDATPQAQADVYEALLDRLAIEKVWLIGLSAGGMSALHFAHQFPARCHGLILISAVSRPMTVPAPVRFMVEHVLTNEFLGWLLVTYRPSLVAQSTGDDYTLVAENPPLKEAFLKLAWPEHAPLRRAGMLNDLRQSDSMIGFNYEEIIVPTLLIHGTADPMVPYIQAEQLAARVNGARLLTFQKGGHLSFLNSSG